jgi:GT2 family glycosyltransferase
VQLGFASRRTRLLRANRRAASQAAGRGDWAEAARLFAIVADASPQQPAVLVQLGHARKEAGDRSGAIVAYRAAADAMPADLDSRQHLSSLHRLLGDDAGAASVYGEMLAIDPDHPQARRGAFELGRRDLVDGMSGADALRRVAERLDETVRAAQAAIATGAVPLSGYDRFRKHNPLPRPPGGPDFGALMIAVDAREAGAGPVHATMTALFDLLGVAWTARIDLGENLADHPVAGFPALDPRISLGNAQGPLGVPTLCIAAGTILDPWAAAWLLVMLDRTGAWAAYGDHDSIDRDWLAGETRSAPWFYDAHDPIGLAGAPTPLAVLFSTDLRPGMDIRAALLARDDAVHIPRVLASYNIVPTPARTAPGAEFEREPFESVSPGRVAAGDDDIVVVIPTRDNAAMLVRMIATMRDRAAVPGRVRFVVIDNRSASAETHSAFARLRRDGVEVVGFDAPFNWSAVNMVGVQGSDAPLLVFANNDMEMRTEGWDRLLATRLADPRIGVIGAKLVYPSGMLQHAGIVMGAADRVLGVHEGVGAEDGAEGPGRRWQRARAASAVTGAFMAMRRTIFDAVGGFDPQFFVAYGDIDLCLRVRAAGRLVVYDPAISLVHHESATRGVNRNAEEIAFDESELTVLARRWGTKTLRLDPGYNPQWAVGGRPFDGFREPPLSDVLRHVDLARGGSSWRVEPLISA